MTSESRHVRRAHRTGPARRGVRIRLRPGQTSRSGHPGLGKPPSRRWDGRWFVESPMGRVGPRLRTRATSTACLITTVTLPSGQVFYNPMRVTTDGKAAARWCSRLRRQPDTTDEEFGARRGCRGRRPDPAQAHRRRAQPDRRSPRPRARVLPDPGTRCGSTSAGPEREQGRSRRAAALPCRRRRTPMLDLRQAPSARHGSRGNAISQGQEAHRVARPRPGRSNSSFSW